MYIFTKNTKIICLSLMVIGLIAIGSGFYSASKKHYSDQEIYDKVIALSHQENNHIDNTQHVSSHGGHHDKESEFSGLFHLIEAELHCHFSKDEIAHAQTIDDVIHTTQHYFHAAKQRPWSSLLASNLFFLMISLAALVWLAVQYISQSGWSASLLRIPQAVTAFLPYGGIIMLFIIITGALHWHHTFHWMDASLTYEYVVENSIDSNHPIYTNEKGDGVF